MSAWFKRGQVPLPERPATDRRLVGCFAQRYLTPLNHVPNAYSNTALRCCLILPYVTYSGAGISSKQTTHRQPTAGSRGSQVVAMGLRGLPKPVAYQKMGNSIAGGETLQIPRRPHLPSGCVPPSEGALPVALVASWHHR